MATTLRPVPAAAGSRERPAGAGQAPPVDALHPHGRVRRRTRCPIIVARRGLLRLGRARQALPRRAVGAVLRQRRPRPRRARRGGGRAGARARLLHELELRPPARDRAGRAHRRARPGRPQPRLLHLRRLRGRRVGAEARAQLPPPARRRAARTRSSRASSPTTASRSARSPRPGITGAARAVRAAGAGRLPRAEHERATTGPTGRDPLWAADAIEERILFEGPETVAAVILEPVQNAGGCFTPQEGYFQRVREICDRHGVLLISDEVICSWGRLGHYFGCERYGYQPDIITTAKGLTSAYAPMGAMIVSDRDRGAVHGGQGDVRPRLHVRRPPGRGGRGAREPRHLRARGPLRARARQGGRVPRDARGPARPADRRRRARRRLLPGDRARQGQGDARRASTTRSPSGCCAASSPASSSSGG